MRWHACVVVPAKGSPDLVAETLRSVAVSVARAREHGRCDIVLVDDSPDDDASLIAQTCRDVGATYLHGTRTVAVKRNVGARATDARYLIFLDSDCTVSEDFVECHVERLRSGRASAGRRVGAVAGPVLAESGKSGGGSALWLMAEKSDSFQPQLKLPSWFAEVTWAGTANLSLARETFEAIGGFDEHTYTVVGGEDVDICMRLQDAGFAILAQPAAIAYHATSHIQSFGQLRRKMYMYGRSSVYNAMRQPHHQEGHANPVAILALIAALSAGQGTARVIAKVAAGAAALHVTNTARTMLRNRTADVMAAHNSVLLDWFFDLGIAVEAVRRGAPRFAFHRYRYNDLSRLVPHREEAAPGAR